MGDITIAFKSPKTVKMKLVCRFTNASCEYGDVGRHLVCKDMMAWFKNGSHSHSSLLGGFKDNLKQEGVTIQLHSPGG